MRAKELFPAIQDETNRSQLLERLCSIKHVITTIHTLIEDTKYLEPCSRILKKILPSKKHIHLALMPPGWHIVCSGSSLYGTFPRWTGKHLGKTLESAACGNRIYSPSGGSSFLPSPSEMDTGGYVSCTVIVRLRTAVRSKTACDEFGLQWNKDSGDGRCS